ncbi:MAG: hypothetical protein UIB63_06180 [Methanobrevibacter sp.]|uniref:hypothetical protein n=1 Tax=Methanobrevibacter sp. TaxID=66852 RepID=UPI002E788269|nr:hypothetical protein [Methanobrevibacter sp.]MEE0942679.1 hypothetical protein [Methanobrevibacter sp.]
MKVDKRKIKAHEEELIHFIGFLPMEFLGNIDAFKRNEYLKKIGEYDAIQYLNHIYRVNASKYGKEYDDKLLRAFLKDNPRFKDCIISF